MIYFDNSATTKPHPEVMEAMNRAATEYFANPSSIHDLGGKAGRLLKQSHEVAARALEVSDKEIIFTSGGTESNNAAIKGIALQYRNRGKHVITSAVEHSSVYEAFHQLERLGYEVTRLPVDGEGRVSVDDVRQALRDDTILVSVMHVNNEMGSIQPVQEIGKLLATRPKTYFHVDAVQAFGKVELRPAAWGVDLLTLSAHKFHGPKGVGLLYVRKGVEIFPLLAGGGQEEGYRSGTENLPGIVGMAKAMKMAAESFADYQLKLQNLRSSLLAKLEKIAGCHINSPVSANGAPHIVNFSFSGLKAEVIIHALEEKQIYVSTRSACSSKEDQPSRVLMAAGLGEERAKSAIRVSFSPQINTVEEVEQFAAELERTVIKLKEIMKV